MRPRAELVAHRLRELSEEYAAAIRHAETPEALRAVVTDVEEFCVEVQAVFHALEAARAAVVRERG